MRSYFGGVSAGRLGLGISFLFLVLFGTTGCGVFGGGSSANGQLRVLQAAPGVPSVNVLIDNVVVSSSVGFGANTGFLSVREGTRHLQVVPTGASAAIVDESVNVPSSGEVTVIVNGVAPSITGMILTDNNTAAATGTAQLRLVNAAPSMPTADVYAVAADSGLGGSPTVPGLAFGQVSSYQTLTIPTTAPTESFSIFFTQPGTTLVLEDTGAIAFASGQNRTIVALNRDGGGITFTLLTDLN